jgi:threonine dehydratase
MSAQAVTLATVQAAARTIAGQVVETPFLYSRTLSEVLGAEIWLKFENLQFTASFKERGALARLSTLSRPERERGVIAASAGNHAQGVAYHARRLGIPCVIVMPRFTASVKVERTRALGAEVLLAGDGFDDAQEHALDLAPSTRLTFVHAYDDPQVAAGQGTLALEMLAQQPGLESLVIPIGGGGLITGMAAAAKALKPGIEIVGVQSARFPALYCARKGLPPEFGSSSIADGIAVRQPGQIVRDSAALIDDIVLVEEGDIEQAIVMLLEIEKTVAEGAAAAGIAAVLRNRSRFAGRKVGLVLTGGNIDPLNLAFITERGLARSGRLVRLSVELRDLPGSLAQVTARLAGLGANIEEVHHHRTFTQLPLHTAAVEFVLQTRNHEHVREVLAALEAAGFTPRLHDAQAGG